MQPRLSLIDHCVANLPQYQNLCHTKICMNGTKKEKSEDPAPTQLNSHQFRAQYEKGFQRTLRFIGSRSEVPAEAEEIAQAAWMKGWQRRSQLRNPKKILAWVNTIALNLLRQAKRKGSRKQELFETPDQRQQPSSAGARVDLLRLLSGCEPKDRKLLVLHHIEGYTTSEAGKRLGLKPTAARVRLMRLRRRLRKRLAARPSKAKRASEQRLAAAA